MPTSSSSSRLSALHPEVRTYSWEHFDLASDLRHLWDVWEASAPEGTVFYAARILEALAAAGVERFRMDHSPNVWSNLKVLQQFGLLDESAMYWAHALRRIGNQARHVSQPVGIRDAELALALTDRVLTWFFCRFPGGPGLEAVAERSGRATPEGDAALRHVLQQIDEGAAKLDLASFDDAIFVRTPEVPGVVAEILIDAGRLDDAHTLLRRALAVFPDVPRLQQLMGLHYSRAKKLDEALDWLVPLTDGRRGDEETFGILAGVRKRRWDADRANRKKDLERSHRGYMTGWKRSGRANTYLGINAAATALWLGDKAKCDKIAGQVLELFESRLKALEVHFGDARARLSYWDQVTLAEAALLLGDLERAGRCYADAFCCYAGKNKTSNIKTTKKQAHETLAQLGLEGKLTDVLGSPVETKGAE